MPRKRRFTLIELLVVISIIAILAAMLLPVLGKARDKARQISCANQIKQIGGFIQMYADEHQDFFPMWDQFGAWDSSGLMQKGLECALMPYTRYKQGGSWLTAGGPFFICPSAPLRWDAGYQGGKYLWGNDAAHVGFTTNAYEGSYEVAQSGFVTPAGGVRTYDTRAWSFRTYSRPNQTPIQWCSRRGSPLGSMVQYNSPSTSNSYGSASWHVPDPYGGPRPTVFLDGHVAILISAQYTRHRSTAIMTGPYSGFHLGSGGGSPKHDPWDYWIDEY